MTQANLEEILNEVERFHSRCKDLMECTASNTVNDINHYEKYGYDMGLNSGCRSSKTRAAVKRSAIDLRNELAKINKVG